MSHPSAASAALGAVGPEPLKDTLGRLCKGWFDNNNTSASASAAKARDGADALSCCVEGDGLSMAKARMATSFTIEAYKADGTPRTTGGDKFAVFIRGRGEKVRSKVVDHQNGQYTCHYTPYSAGKLMIAVTLRGGASGDSLLPGSPHICHVVTSMASAPMCVIRGRSLQSATARKEEFFEVQFKDPLGQVAHAEDLDVYVEDGADAPLAAGYGGAAETGPKVLGSMPASRPAGAAGYRPLVGTHECLVTSKKPLVLRAGRALDSEKLTLLYPGQVLTLHQIELGDEDGEEVRQ